MRRAWIVAMVSILAGVVCGRAFGAADGAAVYAGRCSGCHKATGAGAPGIFPPLAGHAAALAAADRAYGIRVLLFGLTGEIRVGGKTYDGRMPAYADLLKDDEIAAVLNDIFSAWGNDKALPAGHAEITAAEVAAQRAAPMTPEQVFAERSKLKLD